MQPIQANVPCLIHEMQQAAAPALEVVEAEAELPNTKAWVRVAKQEQVAPLLSVDNTGWI
jgi:hypothetical protein